MKYIILMLRKDINILCKSAIRDVLLMKKNFVKNVQRYVKGNQKKKKRRKMKKTDSFYKQPIINLSYIHLFIPSFTN